MGEVDGLDVVGDRVGRDVVGLKEGREVVGFKDGLDVDGELVGLEVVGELEGALVGRLVDGLNEGLGVIPKEPVHQITRLSIKKKTISVEPRIVRGLPSFPSEIDAGPSNVVSFDFTRFRAMFAVMNALAIHGGWLSINLNFSVSLDFVHWSKTDMRCPDNQYPNLYDAFVNVHLPSQSTFKTVFCGYFYSDEI